MALSSGPLPFSPQPRDREGLDSGTWHFQHLQRIGGLVRQEPSALVLSLAGPLRREGVSVSPAEWPRGQVSTFQWRRPSLGGGGRGRGTGERLPLAAVLSSSPHTQQRDEAAQRTCAGLLSYYTWATPVTVKATPSAVSTSSQRGCNVIISREILPRNAKQGHGSGGPGPGVWGESSISPLQLGWAGVLLQREGGRFEGLWGGVCEETRREAEQHRCSVLPTAQMSPAQGSLAGGVGEGSREVGGGGPGRLGVAGVAVCGWPGNAPEVLVPPAVLCWSSVGVMVTSRRGLRLILALLGTPRCPGKLCLLAWHAQSLPAAGPRWR